MSRRGDEDVLAKGEESKGTNKLYNCGHFRGLYRIWKQAYIDFETSRSFLQQEIAARFTNIVSWLKL